MKKHWTLLSGPDERVFLTTRSFLDGRMAERNTVAWALGLKCREDAKRLAVLDTLDRRANELPEPWKTAWRLIEESWDSGVAERDDSGGTFEVAVRIRGGERSGSLVDSIVALVQPGVNVEPLGQLDYGYRRVRAKPRVLRDVMSVSVTSGESFDPAELTLGSIAEAGFVAELAYALDAAVLRGIAIGERLFGAIGNSLWRLGDLRRVYFVPAEELREDEHEPDQFHHGIAPSVKLLFAVVERLCALDTTAGVSMIRRWLETETPIHQRLWAAAARNPALVSAEVVARRLGVAGEREFWDIHRYPEFAELRAIRFSTLSMEAQRAILQRVRRGPPADHWPLKAARSLVSKARRYWTARELRRIQLGGGTLPEESESWLAQEAEIDDDIRVMSRLDAGFIGTEKAHWVAADPDEKFDFVLDLERLRTLETALTAERGGWEDDPARRASDWIRTGNNVERLISDFAEFPDSGAAFPRVLDRLVRSHAPAPESASPERDPRAGGSLESAQRLLSLLTRLPESTALAAIDGISEWLDSWARRLADRQEIAPLWLRLWPLGTRATNAQQDAGQELSLSVVARVEGNGEAADLDTLNTPAGRLVGAFLAMCPSAEPGVSPFEREDLRAMRDAAMTADGRSLLIVHHRFVEQLAYFLAADHDWAVRELIEPLRTERPSSVFLWRAVGRRVRHANVLRIIGDVMAERAADNRLGRETRQSLVFSIVIDTLHAFNDRKPPSVPHAKVMQMLRSLDDEVRAYAANAVQRYVKDMTRWVPDGGGKPAEADMLFRRAAQPFLEQVWPQERSLATPGVARAFADLPAVSGGAFADAVDAIERFLVPFDCWSLLSYGLYGDVDGKPKLARIDSADKANAFLRLLNATVSTAEGAIVPSDLGSALDVIQEVAPRLADSQAFRRLAALARR